jgi:Fe2+ or Zn2+ uptake regulation protein
MYTCRKCGHRYFLVSEELKHKVFSGSNGTMYEFSSEGGVVEAICTQCGESADIKQFQDIDFIHRGTTDKSKFNSTVI